MILARLTPAVGADEATAMMREIFYALKRYRPVDIVIKGDTEVLEETEHTVAQILHRVIDGGEPLQYVLGYAYFMGMELKVTPAVLIPRPETAQLVDIITDNAQGRHDLNVLDVGTGSGCIAIALARALPFARITAIDISAEALAVARENAANLKVSIDFRQEDALHTDAPAEPCYDIIVSNPPYIAESEKTEMDARVYEKEPVSALFVPDNNPLIFYKAITQYALHALRPNGTLYFEINPIYAEALRKYIIAAGFTDCMIVRDYKGNNRFTICRL